MDEIKNKKGSECVAFDDDGSLMSLYTINTIAPVLFALPSKELASFHIKYVENSLENLTVEQMLPIELYDKKTGIRTHIMNARPGYENTIRNQQATMWAESLNGVPWISDTFFYLEDKPDPELIKSKMCFVLGDTNKLLSYLGFTPKKL